jgi:signal transduction histidine kinase
VRRSLVGRLLIALLATQIGAILLAMLVFPLISPYVSFADIADQTLRARIVQSLQREGPSQIVLRPTRALSDYLSRRPGVRFAVMTLGEGRVVQGSNAALSEVLRRVRPIAPKPDGNLETAMVEGKTLIITRQNTPAGPMLIATAGNVFGPEDWPSFGGMFLGILLPIYGLVIVGAMVLIPVTVNLITRPLRRLAGQAGLITPGDLERRLDETGLGPELQALARAVNQALQRLAEGVARQRVYAANAAHELRTPLAILGLDVDRLPAGELKTKLQSDVARIHTLVEQWVTVAALGQSQASLEEPIELVELVSEVVADRAPLAIRQGRELELHTRVPRFLIKGNRLALFSALANILDNAISLEPRGGVVHVALSEDGAVSISDHGPGIAPADRTHVFEPFWRANAARPGSGLGLAIVREVADRHGVPVEIVDTPGGGATFRLRFSGCGHSAPMSC